MIGKIEIGTLQHAAISAVIHEGLTVTANGKRCRLAVIDDDGNGAAPFGRKKMNTRSENSAPARVAKVKRTPLPTYRRAGTQIKAVYAAHLTVRVWSWNRGGEIG